MHYLFTVAKNNKKTDLKSKIHSKFFQKEKGEKISTQKWLIKGNRGGECMRASACRQLSVSQEAVTDRSWHNLPDSGCGRNNAIHNDNMPKKTEYGEKLVLMMKKINSSMSIVQSWS